MDVYGVVIEIGELNEFTAKSTGKLYVKRDVVIQVQETPHSVSHDQ